MKEYHIVISECEEGGFVAHHKEYDKYGDGDTPLEALVDLTEVLEDVESIFNTQ